MEPHKIIHHALTLVQIRQRTRRAMNAFVCGLVASHLLLGIVLLVAFSLGFFRTDFCAEHLLWLPIFCIFIGLLGGLIGFGLGFLWPCPLQHCAESLDQRYHLKDRLLTAQRLLSQAETTSLERLQIRDAAESVRQLDIRAAYPLRCPRFFRFLSGVLLLCLATTLGLVWAFSVLCQERQIESLRPQEQPFLEKMEKIVETTKTLVRSNPEELALRELEPILLELEKMLQQLSPSQSAVRNKEKKLIPLSEIAESVNKAIEVYHLRASDPAWQRMAAMNMVEQENELSHVTQSGVRPFDMRQQMQGEAQETRKQDRSKEILETLMNLKELLAEETSKARRDETATASTHVSNASRSISPTRHEADLTHGEGAVQRDIKLVQKFVTGIRGEGESTTEKTMATENDSEVPYRNIRKTHWEFPNASESAVEAERIPLRQREIIRRYFVAIHSSE